MSITALGSNPLFWLSSEQIPESYSLEKSLQDRVLQIDLSSKCAFQEFLSPNEGNPEQILDHISQTPGEFTLVGTGTERNFFHLAALMDPRCKGVAVVDINPKVKAYNDFNTLLLRLSDNFLEYAELSAEVCPDTLAFDARLKTIGDKLEAAAIEPEMKTYYREHLESFGKVYFSAGQNWKYSDFSSFERVRYSENEQQFLALQQYAKRGQIVSVVGNIRDLRFLEDRRLIVDTSNISDYEPMNFKLGPNIARVIATEVRAPQGRVAARFKSREYKPLLQSEKSELKRLLNVVRTTLIPQATHFGIALRYRFNCSEEDVFCPSPQLIEDLKSYIEMNIAWIGDTPMVISHKNFHILDRLYDATDEELIAFGRTLQPALQKEIVILCSLAGFERLDLILGSNTN